jgi:hypothetical protein
MASGGGKDRRRVPKETLMQEIEEKYTKLSNCKISNPIISQMVIANKGYPIR